MKRRRGEDQIVGLPKVNQEVVYPHVFGNADREVGGILVGRQPGDGGLPLVTGAIEALRADEQRATLTFTQDAWEHVHRTLDSQYGEDEQIVGWYHSHPGFGIFLSEHDLFIHRNFFSGPSQIALVVDPLAGTDGVFVWRDGEIVALYERSTPEWPGLGQRSVSVPPPVVAGQQAAGGGGPQEPGIHRGLLLGAGGLACFFAGAVVAAVLGLGGTTKTETVTVPVPSPATTQGATTGATGPKGESTSGGNATNNGSPASAAGAQAAEGTP